MRESGLVFTTGHSGMSVTELVYRHQIRRVIQTGTTDSSPIACVLLYSSAALLSQVPIRSREDGRSGKPQALQGVACTTTSPPTRSGG
jgi:hypothetical protein